MQPVVQVEQTGSGKTEYEDTVAGYKVMVDMRKTTGIMTFLEPVINTVKGIVKTLTGIGS